MADLSEEDVIKALNFLGNPASTRLRGPIGFPYSGSSPLGGFSTTIQQAAFQQPGLRTPNQQQQPPGQQPKPPTPGQPPQQPSPSPQQPGIPPKDGIIPRIPGKTTGGDIPQKTTVTTKDGIIPQTPSKTTGGTFPTPSTTTTVGTFPPGKTGPNQQPGVAVSQLPSVPVNQQGGSGGGFDPLSALTSLSRGFGGAEIGQALIDSLVPGIEGGPIGAAIGALAGILSGSLFGGTGRIKGEKVAIQDLLTPTFRQAEPYGYSVRDNHALQFKSGGVQRQLASKPELAKLAPGMQQGAANIVQKAFGSSEAGWGERLVNQFLANAAINNWSPAQTSALWQSLVEAARMRKQQPVPLPPPEPTDDTVYTDIGATI